MATVDVMRSMRARMPWAVARRLLKSEGLDRARGWNRTVGVFGSKSHSEQAEPAIDVKTLHAKIGELTLLNDFLSGALGKAGLLPSAKR